MAETTSYHLESLEKPKKTAMELLCVHGLNQNPSAMKTLLSQYQKHGIHCHLLHLPDHQPGPPREFSAEDILEAYKGAFSDVQSRAQKAKVPMGYLGFSYGGLLGVSNVDQCRPDKMILLAPALRLRFYTLGLRWILPWVSKVLSVPIGPSEIESIYRFHLSGVPSSVYSAFFENHKGFLNKEHLDFEGIQGAVYIHPSDELVSFQKLKQWVSEKTPWTFHKVSHKGASLSRYSHLILDSRTLGSKNFQELAETSTAVLLGE